MGLGIGLIRKVTAVFNQLAKGLCVALMASLSMVILLQVFYRYVLNAPLVWPEELARYLQIWLTFVGASIAVQEGGHVRVGFLIDRLPSRVRRCLGISVDMLLVAFLIVFVIQSYQIVQMKAMQRSETLGITLLLPAVGLVVGGLLMLIQFLGLILSARPGGDAESQPVHPAS